jgi:hypothetical protein
MFGVAAAMLAIAAIAVLGPPPIVLHDGDYGRALETFKTMDECEEREDQVPNSYCTGYTRPRHYGGIVLRLESNNRPIETFKTMDECQEREKHTQDAYCTTWRGRLDWQEPY